MKKCRHCDEIYDDNHTTCMKCGEYLGSPLSKNEEILVNCEMQAKLKRESDKYAQESDFFVVNTMTKILALLYLVGTLLLVLLQFLGYGDSYFIVFVIFVAVLEVIDLLFPKLYWELIKPRNVVVTGKMEPSDFIIGLKYFRAYLFLIIGYIYLISVFIGVFQ